MAQEALQHLLLVVLSLSETEQEWFSRQLNERISTRKVEPYSLSEIDARLDETERQIEEGRWKTTEQVFHSQKQVAV